MESIPLSENNVFRKVLKYCPKPCGGIQPCIRTCLCRPGMMLDDEGKCKTMSSKVKNQLVTQSEGVFWKINEF